jgi:hypothetical protein
LSVIGLVLQLAYRLRRHIWLAWSLARWLGLLLVAAGVGALIRWWLHPWPAVLLGVLFLAYVAVLGWAARRRYVHFEAMPNAEMLLEHTLSAAPLRTEELVPLRASGWFTVERRRQYYMDLEADFETVGTREHIILARVYPSRFLRLGWWPSEELGWWYIFFGPATIRELEVGHLCFGRRPHQALRIVYAPDAETTEIIYLTSEDASALRRVWEDLLLDAPPDIVVPEVAEHLGD